MIYAPVLITTLNRSEHLKRLIESLEKNPYVVHTDVFIYVDYPPNEKYFLGYREVLEYLSVLKNNHQFKNLTIVKRNRNFGSLNNFQEAIDDVFSTYDYLITIDDDDECSPDFLEWMDKCLEKYENDEDVISVLGYSYPLEWETSVGATAIKQHFVNSDWGIGYWKFKYYNLKNLFGRDKYFHHIKHILNRQRFPALIDARYIDLLIAASNVNEESPYCKVFDVTMGTYIGISNKFSIMPVKSKVRNYGFDGTGAFCSETGYDPTREIDAHNYDHAKQPIDENEHIDIIENELDNLEVNRDLLNTFDSRSAKQINQAKLRYILYRVIGEKAFTLLWTLKKG